MDNPTVVSSGILGNPVNTGERAAAPAAEPVDVRVRYVLLLAVAFGALLVLVGLSDLLVMYKSKELYAQLFEMNQSYRKVGMSLEQVRSGIHISNVLIRDFLLDPSFTRADSYRSEMLTLRKETDKHLDDLQHASSTVRAPQLETLRVKVYAYWDSLNPVFEWNPAEKRASSYIFLRREVMPRRDAVLQLADQIQQFSETSLAREQRDIQTSEREFKTFEKRMMAASLALALVLAFVCLIRVRMLEKLERRQYQRANESKRRALQAEDDMRQLSRQLVQAQEEERRSIARELHDEVGQMLTGLRMELKSLQRLQSSPKELFDARLDKTKSLIEKTVRSVRGLAMGLRPSMLDDLGLRPALEWQSREFERLYEIPVALTLSESIDFLPEDHRITIYRIIQEALTNCARHAQAKNIDVEVLDKQGTIQITIADDGVGFTRSSRTGPGLGLLGIQERVHRLGGLFEVKPREGGGTVLVAEIPSEDMVIGYA